MANPTRRSDWGGTQMRPVRIGTTARFTGLRTRALVLLAAIALLTLSLGAGVAGADGGRDHGRDHGRDQRSAENTFTKWVTTPPAMAGVVGGDVGAGTFAGEILKRTVGTTSTVIEALYHFNGSKHSFTALVHVEQTGLKAVIIGVVTEGWLKGNMVQGEYTQITCVQAPSSTSGTCFQGTLDIMRGSKSKD